MRWESLQLNADHADDPGVPGTPLLSAGTRSEGTRSEGTRSEGTRSEGTLFGRGAVTRTFDTPGFQGMTFYEVQARSIINRVPEASRMAFRWTINPYRGCTHACAYCLSGETPILMADGRTRPLAE